MKLDKTKLIGVHCFE